MKMTNLVVSALFVALTVFASGCGGGGGGGGNNGGGGSINNKPAWQVTPANITISGGSIYSQTNGTAQDADASQTLACSNNGASCGFAVTVSGSGASPRNCNVGFTAPVTVQSCNLRITATDNGSPALSVGQTISITVKNNAPTWQTAPTDITITGGSAYNQADGAAQDVNTDQTLTCSSNGTSCGFSVTVGGASANPQNCNVSFTAPAPAQTCNLRITVTDNGSPAASVGATISITIKNHAPTWSTSPSNITITGGSTYNQTNGVTTDVDTGQTLTCSNNGTSCGFAITVSGSGLPANCNINFTASVPAGTCNLRIAATDNGSPAASVGATISITTKNHTPTWQTAPANVTITGGSTYNQTNGIAQDVDTGQTLTCSNNGTSCGFSITVSGSGASPRNCNVSFTAPVPAQTCNLRVAASDNGSPSLSVGSTISITVKNHAPTWSSAPTNITITAGSVYNKTNGTAMDVDTGQTLTCGSSGSDCSFTVTVSGSGASPRNCNMSFTVGAYYQNCDVGVQVSDGNGGVITQTVNITVNGPKNWTIMVLMDGDNNLETYAISDFNEMEEGLASAIAAGDSDIQDSLNVIVMIDRISGYNENPTEQGGSNWTDTRLYRVKPDSATDDYFRSERLDDGGAGAGHIANLGEKDMGDPAVLSLFISYCKTNFPASHYALILWDHGSGARAPGGGVPTSSIKEVNQDDTSSDGLFLDEVQQAIAGNFDSTHKLSVLYFDACMMGMVEVAYEFRNLVEYMVGSMQLAWSGEGLLGKYHYFFTNLTGTKDESVISPSDMSVLFVNAYKYFIDNYSLNNQGATMSVTDLSKISSLAANVNSLAVQIDAAGMQTDIETVRDASVHFYSADDDSVAHPFYDLYDFCNRIYTDTTNGFPTALKNAANTVISSLSSAIVYSYGDNGNGQSSYLGVGSSTKRGLSIFFSRGNLQYSGYSHYAYQWWYTSEDTVAWATSNGLPNPDTYLYGNIDFCTSNGNGTVESWRELFEKWYDPTNISTPSSY